jgi:hypothetical protein
LNVGEPRYEAYACPGGLTERWTHKRLLYGTQSIDPVLQPGRRMFFVLYPDQVAPLWAIAKSNGWHAQLAWRSAERGIDVLELER